MFDARYFTHNPLQWFGGKRGNLLSRGPRVLHKNVHHRHFDLRIFLPGGKSDTSQTHQNKDDD